jgi:hypothetical protein
MYVSETTKKKRGPASVSPQGKGKIEDHLENIENVKLFMMYCPSIHYRSEEILL